MTDGRPGSPGPEQKGRRGCPICGKPATKDAYPFCSRRCADVDLNRWLSGGYVIPAAEEAPREGEDAED